MCEIEGESCIGSPRTGESKRGLGGDGNAKLVYNDGLRLCSFQVVVHTAGGIGSAKFNFLF